MPRLSYREANRRGSKVYNAWLEAPNANARQLARATGVPEDWIRDYMVQVRAGLQNKAHTFSPDLKRTYAKGPWLDLLKVDLKNNPPTTIMDAWRRMQSFGVKCSRQHAPKYLRQWGLPVPAATRGATAVNKRPNKKLEELKSAVRVLCMQHPDAVPTVLIEELLDGH